MDSDDVTARDLERSLRVHSMPSYRVGSERHFELEDELELADGPPDPEVSGPLPDDAEVVDGLEPAGTRERVVHHDACPVVPQLR